ncbi:MAG: adenosylcobinamide-GDP ribazoletransferase [Pseudomonadota bacterium]
MTVRGLIVATQFLTRLPTPRIDDWRDDDLARAANWFPVVGLILGALLAATAWLAAVIAPLLLPLCVLVVWVWLTGALHLDGLADTADGLGGAHAQSDRFLKIARTPDVGAFGVVAVALVLLAKLHVLSGPAVVTALQTNGADAARVIVALILIPAWARWSANFVALMLPALDAGRGGSVKSGLTRRALITTAGALAAASLVTAPALVVAPLAALALTWYWRHALGGVTGDVLGATIEIVEAALLAALVVGLT